MANLLNPELLLPDAPNFSRYLVESLDGEVIVSDTKILREGYLSSKRFMPDRHMTLMDEERFLELATLRDFRSSSYFRGPFNTIKRVRIRFRENETPDLRSVRQELLSENLADEGQEPEFRDVSTVDEVMNRLLCHIGELKIYLERKDKQGRMPMIYDGFIPGRGHEERLGVSHVGLLYGTMEDLAKLDNRFNPNACLDAHKISKQVRMKEADNGASLVRYAINYDRALKRELAKIDRRAWMRFDGHKTIPFP